ncbi:hypothetical protein GCWU000321_01170 [Dialister invisus DSM 15470]|jgi:gluconate kinase|uniref:Uncharacterized protein n=1 Tax=Dialister invisus DSM 15470 TaxID=592028 RepID=C9LNP7_9FIRM|nr:hypothetical protein [Dialister invisus]EEW97183.1 hypothetical protein GCWU000321_01170 [Dialister invisus DSM 15470]
MSNFIGIKINTKCPITRILTGKTIREITKAVEDERKSGVLICSRMEGKGGYFMPANDVEIQSQLASFERRIKSQEITLWAFRRYVKERAISAVAKLPKR